ncbi:MAG: hypothetical protein NVS4B3_21440 [Gemmatimonadaceae bacterium]
MPVPTLPTAGGPQIIIRNLAVYFVTGTGDVWRVYDVVSGYPHTERGRTKSLKPPNARAQMRRFVAADGRLRVYEFEAGEVRELIPDRLEDQLRDGR